MLFSFFNKIKFQFHWRFREFFERLNLIFSKEIVLIYTMGKVGSSSIYLSLKEIIGGKVLFTHRMHKKNIDAYNKVFLNKKTKPHRTKVGEILLKKIVHKKIKIITLIRDPISRNISDFFQDLNIYIKNYKQIDSYSNQYILDQFMQNYVHKIPLNWFQNEFYATTNINVFETPFNTERKYCFLKNKNIDVLIIRTDLEDLQKEELIKEFLNLKEFKIKRKNLATEKYYSVKYKSFLEACNLNKEYVTRMFDSSYSNHFFTKYEIEKLKKKFTENNNTIRMD